MDEERYEHVQYEYTYRVIPSDRLLPCPFCVGTAELQEHVDARRTTYVVVCISCAADGPWEKSATSAARAWNARTNA
jgi:Lar family restriction alleviation protein